MEVAAKRFVGNDIFDFSTGRILLKFEMKKCSRRYALLEPVL
jgi:hypothetical protein